MRLLVLVLAVIPVFLSSSPVKAEFSKGVIGMMCTDDLGVSHVWRHNEIAPSDDFVACVNAVSQQLREKSQAQPQPDEPLNALNFEEKGGYCRDWMPMIQNALVAKESILPRGQQEDGEGDGE